MGIPGLFHLIHCFVPFLTLFAAGLSSPDDARAVVEGGVYRLCVEASLLADGDVTENAAAFSRLLGRMI